MWVSAIVTAASQEEALRSRRARLSTHPHQEVWSSRATKFSTLQTQVVLVISGPPVSSDTTTCGHDSGLGSTHPLSTQIFSSASLLCLLPLEHLFKSCGVPWATETGSRWNWKSLVCGLHAGGSRQMVVEVCDLEWQTSRAASRVTEQPYLGSALLTSHDEGPRKGGPNIVRSIFPRT